MDHANASREAAPQRVARITGALFVATFITAIASLVLYGPVLDDAAYVLTGDADARISLGALFEILLVVANIGTAVVLYPVLKRQSETLALGYVASRIVESTVIAIGAISLLSVVTLGQDVGGAGQGSLLVAAASLVAIHDWTFLLGPGFCVAIGNGLILGYLMYRSGLVPRPMAVLGLVAGSLIFVSSTAVLFGLYEQTSATHFLFSIPEIAWEGSLGAFLLVKGFRSTLPAWRDTPGPTYPALPRDTPAAAM